MAQQPFLFLYKIYILSKTAFPTVTYFFLNYEKNNENLIKLWKFGYVLYIQGVQLQKLFQIAWYAFQNKIS